MKSGFSFLDTYTLRARVFPAILAAMPALALMGAFVSLKEFSITQTLAGIGLLAVIWIFADRAQRLGKQLETGIWARMGGMPSITALRYRDATFNEISKASYHAFLAKKLGVPAPTAEQEAADLAAADAFYDRACAWLRDRTRLYHIVRFIGRWSMIDIFMESLLGALVAFGSVITIQPGMGAVAFCAVVILTMFAAETFDPRLMWDAAAARSSSLAPARG